MLEALRERQDDQAATVSLILNQLPALLSTFTSAGIQVQLDITGTTRPLPPMVEATTYRIIQEALTDVTKHAPGASAFVRVELEPHQLRITVRNHAGQPQSPRPAPFPDAVQVADRWHLWHNLAEAVLEEVAAHSACRGQDRPATARE